jgi:hypothetical protein
MGIEEVSRVGDLSNIDDALAAIGGGNLPPSASENIV